MFLLIAKWLKLKQHSTKLQKLEHIQKQGNKSSNEWEKINSGTKRAILEIKRLRSKSYNGRKKWSKNQENEFEDENITF